MPPEGVKKFPSWVRRGLKAVRPSGGGRSRRFAPILAYTRPLPPPKPLRASSPPKIGGDSFTPSAFERAITLLSGFVVPLGSTYGSCQN